jgi:hypothetical protein
MDALTFVKEHRRMCDEHLACVGCPLSNLAYCSDAEPEELVTAVEEWSKEHPLMTNRRKFEEVFGIDNQRIEINSDGYMPTVTIPSSILMRSWWDAEYKGKTDVK